MNVGFFSFLGILFIGLKLTNCIDWSWLWVLSPLWIGFIFGFIVVILSIIVNAYHDASN